jgi:hypothetical protein
MRRGGAQCRCRRCAACPTRHRSTGSRRHPPCTHPVRSTRIKLQMLKYCTSLQRVPTTCTVHYVPASVSNPDPGSIRSVDPYPQKKIRNFMFSIDGCSLLRAEDFFCSLEVLHGGLGKGTYIAIFFLCTFSKFLGHLNPGSESGSVFSLKC